MKSKKKILILIIAVSVIILITCVVLFLKFRKTGNKPEEIVPIEVEQSIAETISRAIESFRSGEYTEFCNYFEDSEEAYNIKEEYSVKIYKSILDYMGYMIVSERVENEVTILGIQVKKLDIKKLSEFSEIKGIENLENYNKDDVSVVESMTDRIKDIIERNKYTIGKNMSADKAYEIQLVKQEEGWKIRSTESFRDAFIYDPKLIALFKNNAPSIIMEEESSLSQYEKNLFNVKWEEYNGEQAGSNARMLVSKLITNVDEYKEDYTRLPTVIYISDETNKMAEGGKTALENIDEYKEKLNDLRLSVNARNIQTVELKYKKGLVEQIIITK